MGNSRMYLHHHYLTKPSFTPRKELDIQRNQSSVPVGGDDEMRNNQEQCDQWMD